MSIPRFSDRLYDNLRTNHINTTTFNTQTAIITDLSSKRLTLDNLTVTDAVVENVTVNDATISNGTITNATITNATIDNSVLDQVAAQNIESVRIQVENCLMDAATAAQATITSAIVDTLVVGVIDSDVDVQDHSIVDVKTLQINGQTGSTVSTRYVGGVNHAPPTTGTYQLGDFVVAVNGGIFVCITAGTPGTWTAVGSGGYISALDFGADPTGATDSTASLQAWLDSISRYHPGYLPPGTYRFSTTLTVGARAGVVIEGAGGFNSILSYNGPATNIDLLQFGSMTGVSAGWTLQGFRITSETMMTDGAGIHIQQMVRGTIYNVTVDGQEGSFMLYHGIWFDRVDQVAFTHFTCNAQQDAVRVNGMAMAPRADLLIQIGKISDSGVGIRVGGNFGGLCVDQTFISACARGIIIDNTLNAVGNRELFFGNGCVVDFCTYDNVVIDEGGNGVTITINGWVVNGVNGIVIESCPFGNVCIGGPIMFGFDSCVVVKDATTFVNISAQTRMSGATVAAVEATVSTTRIQAFEQNWQANALNFTPEAHCGGAWTPTLLFFTSGSVTATCTGNYTVINNWVTAAFNVQITGLSSPVGVMFIGNLPVDQDVGLYGGGTIFYSESMVGLVSSVSAFPVNNIINLYQTVATGSLALTDANIQVGSAFRGVITYRRASL